MSLLCKLGFHDWVIVEHSFDQESGFNYFTKRICLNCSKIDDPRIAYKAKKQLEDERLIKAKQLLKEKESDA